jgi:hypothetical protein
MSAVRPGWAEATLKAKIAANRKGYFNVCKFLRSQYRIYPAIPLPRPAKICLLQIGPIKHRPGQGRLPEIFFLENRFSKKMGHTAKIRIIFNAGSHPAAPAIGFLSYIHKHNPSHA